VRERAREGWLSFLDYVGAIVVHNEHTDQTILAQSTYSRREGGREGGRE